MGRSSQFDHRALTAILARQDQVISRGQALACGMTEDALRHRLRTGGSWQRLLPGVFLAVTGAPTDYQRNVAALLYAGSGGLITGSAALRRFGVRTPPTSMVDVLVSARKQRRSVGFVRVRATTRMPRALTTGPVRIAPLPRAVADTARGLTKLADVRAVVAAVVQQGKCPADLLVRELEEGPMQGSALFRRALGDVCDGTRSGPEAELKELLRRAGVPTPLFNAELYSGDDFIARPDGWWPDAGVAVEVDSREYHLSPGDHERTLARDARMAAHGITVLHFTPRQISTQPRTVVAAIRSALAATRGRPRLTIRALPHSQGTGRPPS